MKVFRYFLLLVIFSAYLVTAQGQKISYEDSWFPHGFNLASEAKSGVKVNFSLEEFYFNALDIKGEELSAISIPGVFLPNDAGAPDLPGDGRMIAIPQNATASVKILNARIEVFTNVDIAPAPVIPLDTEDGPLIYEKNAKIYDSDTFYPAEPVVLSSPTKIRGVDIVMLGVTPFQYNPVTRELKVYRDLEIEITFKGGTGQFGEDRLRSKWFDPVLGQNILNFESLPQIDYNQPSKGDSKSPDYEYLIISPNNSTFLSWADSIRLFRNQQGIYTGIVTTTDIGGNTVSAIQTYVDNAYNTWDVPPVAVLLLGDYNTGTTGITSQWYDHPAGYPDFVSDNYFADVTGNNLPDIAFARITGNNATQLEVMITKFLDYERNPPSSYDFYNHPITALGWQTERWFQICSEVVGGYLKNEHGKDPVRINAIYSGTPGSQWSTATNTTTVVNYFGPNGYGYIPQYPSELGGWSGGNAADVINAINAGSFMLQHRDHGYYEGWGEPAFSSSNINSLTNTNNELPYVFSINCQTGAFHRSAETFTEKFHRHTFNGQNSGALGVMAATEVSYSFVNDTYMWGVMDNMFPDFMGYSTTFPVDFVYPAFGNVAGKHFLYSSSWPYNSGDKLITYRLFHHHGDAFLNVYTEVPQNLTVVHDPVCQAGSTTFTVSANSGSFIALSKGFEILGTADGTGSPVAITIPAQSPGEEILVTVTKQNYYRYRVLVPVVNDGVYAEFSGDNTEICTGSAVNFTDLSFGDVTSWNWTFEGGTPASYNGQDPPPVYYYSNGTFDVTLTVSDGSENDTQIKTDYITVNNIVADFTGTPTTVTEGNTVTFTDNSYCNPTSWSWTFEGGVPNTASGPGPHVITYPNAGTYDVTLVAGNAYGSDTEYKANYINVQEPNFNMQNGTITTCSGNFYDSGGPSGSYGNYESSTLTFYPSSANAYLEFTFTLFDVEYHSSCSYDWLKIYDGVNTSAPLIGTYCGTNSPGTVEATNASGALTFQFYSDYSVTGAGWAASIDCIITSAPPIADFSADNVTPPVGQVVYFTDLTQNDPSSWQWTFNPSTISYIGGTNQYSQNPQVHFNNSGYYSVNLVATNADGSDTETKTNYILAGTGGVWTGNTSTDWNTGSNWENLSLPTTSDDVVIPASAVRWPVRTGDLTLSIDCQSVSMEGNAELTITGDLIVPAGTVFTCNCLESPKIFLYGDMNVQGDFIPGTGFVEFLGSATSIVTGSTFPVEFYDLLISKTDAEVSLNDDVNVSHDLVVNTGGWLTNNNTLNVQGDFEINNSASSKASFIDFGTTTVYGASLVSMQYLDNRWYNISAPVNNAMSYIFLDMYLYYYNEATDGWGNIVNVDYWLEPGYGYLLWSTLGDAYIDFIGGSFNTGDYSPVIQVTDRDNSGTIDADEGWNLVGNAFPSAIDIMEDGYYWRFLTNTIYLFNGSAYATFNRSTGVGTNQGTQYIPSMQGFFVKGTRTNPSPGLTVPNLARVHNSQINYKDAEERNIIHLAVSANGVYADEMILHEFEGASPAYDEFADAYKLIGNNQVAAIYTMVNNDLLAVNAVHEYTPELVIPVYIEANENGLYSIQAGFETYDGDLYLEDLITGQYHEMQPGSAIYFDYQLNDDNHRFNLHFGAPNGLENNLISPITMLTSGNQLVIEKGIDGKAEVMIYNMLGEEISMDSFSGTSHRIQVSDASGYYLVKVRCQGQLYIDKVLIK